MSRLGIALATLAAVAAMTVASGSRARAESRPRLGYVDVAVATVWTDPAKPRPVDAPALTNPVEIDRWLAATTTAQKRWLTERDATQTQALYGARVDILGAADGWYEVVVPGQPTPKDGRGYPGWIPTDQVSTSPTFGSEQARQPFALVSGAATTWLYGDTGLTRRRLQISFDTRLPAVGETASAIEVALPGGGRGWLSRRVASVHATQQSIPRPSAAGLIHDARLFLGRPYLWGGASGFAVDCSGFTYTLFHANGITIGRDASAQAGFSGHGTRIPRPDLRPGDLIFYATGAAASTIDHVAIFIGDERMIEAYGAGVPVRVTPVRLGDGYWGAERLLAR